MKFVISYLKIQLFYFLWLSGIGWKIPIPIPRNSTDTDTKEFNRYRYLKIDLNRYRYLPIPIPRISTDIYRYRYFGPSLTNLKCQCIQTYFTLWLIFAKTVEELLANNQQKPANQMFIQCHDVWCWVLIFANFTFLECSIPT